MFTDQQVEEIVDLLCTLDQNTKIYIGTDSVRFRENGKWFARYATVCVIRMNGKNGCKVFKHRSVEQDFDLKKDRPRMRMVNEAMKSCALYLQLAPLLDGYQTEIHLDINLDEKHGSNCAVKEAAGYALSTGIDESMIRFKPAACAASFGADHFAHNSL